MSDAMTVLWTDLADPTDPETPAGRRCKVAVRLSVVRHIADGHLANNRREREAWIESLGEKAIQGALDSLQSQDEAARLAGFQEFAAALEPPVRSAFLRPMIELREHRQIWRAVLPIGALAVLRRTSKGASLATAYFKTGSLGLSPAQRWRRTVRHLLIAHLKFSPFAQSLVLPPECSSEFVTPQAWGFENGYKFGRWRMPCFRSDPDQPARRAPFRLDPPVKAPN